MITAHHPATRSTLQVAVRSHLGLVRTTNQDAFGTDDQLSLYVVCDGMGGAAGGEVAARLAVDTFLAVTRQELENLHDANQECTRCALQRAVAAANRAVRARADFDFALRGMGTTLVAARLLGETLTVINVGDSRAYLLHQGHAELLTRDHSYVAEQVQHGRMTPEQAACSPYRSVITRAIGADVDVRPDIFSTNLAPDQTLLLTSDGLTRHLECTEIAATVQAFGNAPLPLICDALIDRALALGGADNITCLLLRSA